MPAVRDSLPQQSVKKIIDEDKPFEVSDPFMLEVEPVIVVGA